MSMPHEFYVEGELIDQRYLVDAVRRGMMGVVYLCQDTRTNNPIAIKTFEDRYLNTEKNRRLFLEEAATWIQLGSHPNIVRAYCLKMLNEKPHLIMERIIGDSSRGATLKDYLFSHVIDERKMIQIAIHICNGMIHAIQKFPTWVHRDLKSENILLGQDQLPKITDFGMTMSASTTEVEELDVSYLYKGSFYPKQLAFRMVGTPAFASPEQCLCKPIDTRADIYSFGCILYNLVTRRLPFHCPSVEETIIAQVKEQPVRPREYNSGISVEFECVILTCLRKNPLDRFLSFNALYEELRGVYCDLYHSEPVSFEEGAPISYDEYLDRAWSFVLLGNFSLACKQLEYARRLEPDNKETHYHLGQMRYMQGKFDEALIHLEEAVLEYPEDLDVLEALGKTYLEKEKLGKAALCFETMLSLDAEDEVPYIYLARTYEKLGKMKLTEEVLQNGMKHCPDSSYLLFQCANFYQRIGAYKKEKKMLSTFVKTHPEDIDCLLRLSELCLFIGQKADALHWAKVRSPNEASPSATRGARSYAAELQTQPHDPVLVLVQPYENP